MMRPEDIQNHDFLVGLRGYDKDEVRAFLTEVAAEHEQLLAALEQHQSVAPAQTAPVPAAAPPSDDLDDLGASVAAILRTAKEQAGEMAGEAQARADAMLNEADELRRDAEESARALRQQTEAEVEELRQRVRGEADQLREQAQQQLADARNEAERIVHEATERVRQIESEHEARLNDRTAEVARREEATRQRLLEAADEVQLALVALNDGNDGPTPANDPNHDEGHDEPALG